MGWSDEEGYYGSQLKSLGRQKGDPTSWGGEKSSYSFLHRATIDLTSNQDKINRQSRIGPMFLWAPASLSTSQLLPLIKLVASGDDDYDASETTWQREPLWIRKPRILHGKTIVMSFCLHASSRKLINYIILILPCQRHISAVISANPSQGNLSLLTLCDYLSPPIDCSHP